MGYIIIYMYMFIVTKTQSNGFTHPVLSATTNHHYILTYIVLLSSYSIFQVSRSRPCKQVGRWSQLWTTINCHTIYGAHVRICLTFMSTCNLQTEVQD